MSRVRGIGGSAEADAAIGDVPTGPETDATHSVPDSEQPAPEAGWTVVFSDREKNDTPTADRYGRTNPSRSPAAEPGKRGSETCSKGVLQTPANAYVI
jgi:hypothetical protein